MSVPIAPIEPGQLAEIAKDKRTSDKRHPEYVEFVTVWRWLEDSLEGGSRYREADYGYDPYVSMWMYQDPETGHSTVTPQHHQIPRRNLIRHPQEYPKPRMPGSAAGAIEGAPSTSDEYEFRRALTPVPEFVSEAIGQHLARIFAREVRREAPEGPAGDALRAWWKDVDGSGTTIDDWMQETIAGQFLVLGQLDLAFDHPPPPDGEVIRTQADVDRLGLSAVRASYVLPENVTDWDLDQAKRYARVVTREFHDDQTEWYREWTPEGSTLYNAKGVKQEDTPHNYGLVPIFRAFDVRKPRLNNVGQSRYEGIAQIQRAYYNVDSELTLSNSLAAHAMLSGPEEYCRGDAIQIGPGNVLPMKRFPDGAGYAEWKYVCPPSDAAEKLRQKLMDLRDSADRAACLTKPAGASGNRGQTVSQSGISKMLDQGTGNDLLTKIARSLQRLELRVVEYVLMVALDGPPDPSTLEQVIVTYPTKFDLFTAADFAALISEFQSLAETINGDLPEATKQYMRTYVRLSLPGMDDATYEMIDAELDAFIDRRAGEAEARAELTPPIPPKPLPPIPGSENPSELPVDDEEDEENETDDQG